MNAVTVRPDNPALEWAGAIEVEHTPGWSRAWRLPFSRLDLFPGDGLAQRAAMGAGVRIRFRTGSTTIAGVVASPEAREELSPLDLVIDGEHVATTSVGDDDRFSFPSLPAGEKEIELWLPQFGDFRLVELGLDPGASVALARRGGRDGGKNARDGGKNARDGGKNSRGGGEGSSPKIITYGSSITHCRAAASPTRTWPAIVARELGLDLTSLGFGGQAHLDVMIARMIAALPADFITTCIGINVYGNGTFNQRSFLPAVFGFLSTIRDGHPDTPILVISPIISPSRENEPGPAGMTLRDYRRGVAEAAETLQRSGDDNLHFLDGLDVVGADQESVLFDGLHPDAKGYELMASKIKPVVADLLATTSPG